MNKTKLINKSKYLLKHMCLLNQIQTDTKYGHTVAFKNVVTMKKKSQHNNHTNVMSYLFLFC